MIKNRVFALVILILMGSISSCSQSKNDRQSGPVIPHASEEDDSQNGSSNAESGFLRSPLYSSSDFGLTWQDASNDLPKNCMVSFIELMGDEMVLATDNIGVFLSSNKMSKWKAVGDDLPSGKINALHIDDHTIYVSSFPLGIFYSDDSGTTWNSLNANLTDLRIQCILKVGEQLYIGSDSGIFKYESPEKKWVNVYKGVQVLSLNEYNRKLIAGTNLGSLLSLDGGVKWDWINQEGAVHYTHMVDSTIVEMMIFGDLYLSDDWGENWSNAYYTPRKASYVYEVAGVGDYFLLSNNYGIHHSVDRGKTWQHIFKTEDMAFFDFAVLDNVVYGGTRFWDEYRERSE